LQLAVRAHWDQSPALARSLRKPSSQVTPPAVRCGSTCANAGPRKTGLELCQRPRSLAIVAAGTDPADGPPGWCILLMRAVGARYGGCQGLFCDRTNGPPPLAGGDRRHRRALHRARV